MALKLVSSSKFEIIIILLLLHVKALKISVDLWKTAIKIMNSGNSLCDSWETMGIP